jgi:predicted RNase H-like nuclease
MGGDIAESGSVLGVDIGWAPNDRTTGACRLDWTPTTVSFEYSSASLPNRLRLLESYADRPILVAALDGPLRGDLAVIGHYRRAEQLLTQRFGRRIGKPGQASSPVGKLLNVHANECAKLLLGTGNIAQALHDHAIHQSAIVEAFPSSFLGILLEQPQALATNRARRSDDFYRHLALQGGLLTLLQYLLPNRTYPTSFTEVVHHDETAAVVCALAALCVAAGHYTVVGDKTDGWIILPPWPFIQIWARALLEQNAKLGGLDFRPAKTSSVANAMEPPA